MRGEDRPGRVVRGVEQDEPGAVGHRGAQPVEVEPEVRRPQRHRHPDGAGQLDACAVGVVERLERHHLLTRVDESEQRCGHCLGRAGGDHDLGGGVQVEAVEPFLVLGDRQPQVRLTRPRRVLVQPRPDRRDRRVGHLDRAVGVGEALAEVDRTRLQRQGRHLGENRRAEAGQPAGELLGAHRYTLARTGADHPFRRRRCRGWLRNIG